MQTENRVEGIALRKLREIKGLDRKEAGSLLGVGYKTIEKFENGRTTLNRSRIDKIILSYGFLFDDFCLCRDGKFEQVKSKFCPKKKKVIEHNACRRSYKRIITKEVEVLMVLRKLRGLTQYNASYICGYSKTAVGHIENGRVEIPSKRLKHIVESYGFTIDDFNYHMKAERFVTDIQDECIKIIKELSEEKLKAVHPLLLTFKS